MKLRIDSIEELKSLLDLFTQQPSITAEANEILQFADGIKPFKIETSSELVNVSSGDTIYADQSEETSETDADWSEETSETSETDADQSEETSETDADWSEETSETDADWSEETSETDADGVEWNPAVHSMGKTKTKDGRWRVKKGLQPVDESKTDDFAVQVKKKYISRLEEGELSIEEMMNIFDENGLLSVDDIEKQPQEILELLNEAVGE